MNWNHGTNGLLIGYGLSALGVLIGLLLGRAPISRVLAFPLMAIPVLVVAVLLWTAMAGPLKATAIAAELIPYLGLAFIGIFSGLAGKLFSKLPENKNHERGAILEGASAKRTLLKTEGLTLAGVPVPEADETKHFKMIGTTGTGKSTAIRELLTGALERGDRAVIADPDGSYLKRFYDPHRGDQILNPFNPKAARWDLFGEVTTLHDADQLSRSLIADAEGNEGPWRNYARVFLTSLLRQLHRVKHNDVGELYQLIATTPVDDLRDLLADTPAAPYLVQDNGRFFGAVRAVANTHLSALEHIAHQSSRDSLSVRSWVRTGHGILFLPYRANEIATLRSIISTWMRLAIYETMSQSEDPDPRLGVRPSGNRLWFAIDELDALGQIDGLKDALARLRKFGGRCVLGFQSIAQVSGTYGRAEAQTIVENCGNTLILRCSASEGGGTARFASGLIGEREILREQVTTSRGGGLILARNHRSVSTSTHHVTESAILASEIEQLPDLQGFLKFASQPEWKRVKLAV
ncbi:MAG TPA: type IV secretion system DNA-binding domain-containing protein [Acidobacteriaceae bacterium]